MPPEIGGPARGPAQWGRLTGLSTRGRCLLAGGLATAVCGALLDERDLLRIGAFVALLPVLAMLFAIQVRRSMHVDRELDPPRLAVGSDATVELALRGPALVGSLRMVDAVPDAAGPDRAAPPRFTVYRLSARGRARLRYPIRPVLRGIHQVGPLTCAVTDPLGLAEFERELAGSSPLLVLPRIVALRGMPAALGAGDATQGAALSHQGQGTSDVLVRPYRRGDEIRRVHWRSTARHDELMVRLEERPWRGGITVLLDRRDSAHRGRGADSSLEFAVSLTASICAHLARRGEPATLVTEDGAPLGGVVAEPGGTHVAPLDPVLDALASLRPSARTDLVGPEFDRGDELIAVLGAVAPGQIEPLLARRGGTGYAILLDTAAWDPADGAGGSATAAATALRGAGWRVTVATPSTSPERAWDALVAGAAAA